MSELRGVITAIDVHGQEYADVRDISGQVVHRYSTSPMEVTVRMRVTSVTDPAGLIGGEMVLIPVGGIVNPAQPSLQAPKVASAERAPGGEHAGIW